MIGSDFIGREYVTKLASRLVSREDQALSAFFSLIPRDRIFCLRLVGDLSTDCHEWMILKTDIPGGSDYIRDMIENINSINR